MSHTFALGLLLAALPAALPAAARAAETAVASPAILACLELHAPEPAAAWFAARLGFRETARRADGAAITLERGPDRLTLLRAEPVAGQTARDSLHLVLDADSFGHALAAARRAGDRLLWQAPQRRGQPRLIVHLEGPEGHRIVLLRAPSEK